MTGLGLAIASLAHRSHTAKMIVNPQVFYRNFFNWERHHQPTIGGWWSAPHNVVNERRLEMLVGKTGMVVDAPDYGWGEELSRSGLIKVGLVERDRNILHKGVTLREQWRNRKSIEPLNRSGAVAYSLLFGRWIGIPLVGYEPESIGVNIHSWGVPDVFHGESDSERGTVRLEMQPAHYLRVDLYPRALREFEFLSGGISRSSGCDGSDSSLPGSFIGRAPYSNGDDRVEDYEKPHNKFSPKFYFFTTFFFVLFGFFFCGWGYGWWNGFYDYPNGRSGQILSSASCAIGICFWVIGDIALLAFISGRDMWRVF